MPGNSKALKVFAGRGFRIGEIGTESLFFAAEKWDNSCNVPD
jgi:hypothetical protein